MFRFTSSIDSYTQKQEYSHVLYTVGVVVQQMVRMRVRNKKVKL